MYQLVLGWCANQTPERLRESGDIRECCGFVCSTWVLTSFVLLYLESGELVRKWRQYITERHAQLTRTQGIPVTLTTKEQTTTHCPVNPHSPYLLAKHDHVRSSHVGLVIMWKGVSKLCLCPKKTKPDKDLGTSILMLHELITHLHDKNTFFWLIFFWCSTNEMIH